MQTLEDAEKYFQSKGYNAEICTFKFSVLETKLMVRGRRTPLDPQLGIIGYGSGLFILFTDDEWHLESREILYFQLESKFKSLADAVFAAEAILGPPFEDTTAEREQ